MNNSQIKPLTEADDAECNSRQRHEKRYPCVAIPLLYSAIKHAHVRRLGEKIFQAAAVDMSISGLAFDINQPMQAGEKLQLMIAKSGSHIDDELLLQVRWCRQLPSGKYRVGGVVDRPHAAHQSLTALPGSNGQQEVPAEIEARCPACKNPAIFHFVGNQHVFFSRGIMPLYDCSACGTTRSLTGMLE
ncbi:MAG: PilZ domain-containing protein [Gammaproteobacteria bacterium]|nr:PilZ domain-containing protein [Gammaproteobacteria bacterium]